MNGLREDGHLTDLALEYALDGQPLPATTAHLASCELCAARLEAADALELPELPGLSTPEAAPQPRQVRPANRPWMWVVWVGAAAAAVALLALPVLRPTIDDGLRIKGNGLSLQVYRDEGETSARLRNHDTIEPGDRLGFRVRNRDAGWLLVYGIDDADTPYVCYPQNEGGRAIEVDASPRPKPLPEAIRMDDTPGEERLIAVLCDAPFTVDDVADGELPEGCVSDDLTLDKP